MYLGRLKTDYGIIAGLRLDVRRSSLGEWPRSELQWSAVDPTCEDSGSGSATLTMFEAMGRA